MNCPKCGADITDSYEPDDPSVGIVGGWCCDTCNLGIAEHEVGYDPHETDVAIGPSSRDLSAPIGTPIDRISTQPGTPGYAEWLRFSKSWGYP